MGLHVLPGALPHVRDRQRARRVLRGDAVRLRLPPEGIVSDLHALARSVVEADERNDAASLHVIVSHGTALARALLAGAGDVEALITAAISAICKEGDALEAYWTGEEAEYPAETVKAADDAKAALLASIAALRAERDAARALAAEACDGWTEAMRIAQRKYVRAHVFARIDAIRAALADRSTP